MRATVSAATLGALVLGGAVSAAPAEAAEKIVGPKRCSKKINKTRASIVLDRVAVRAGPAVGYRKVGYIDKVGDFQIKCAAKNRKSGQTWYYGRALMGKGKGWVHSKNIGSL